MSVRSRRFDKYIPLFGRGNDNRVALLLGEMEDNARNALGKIPQGYLAKDLPLTANNTGLHNVNFKDAVPSVADNSVHPEWKKFMAHLALRLGGQAGDVALVQSLVNAKPQSVEDLVLQVLSLIATVTIGGANVNPADYRSQLNQVTVVTFKSATAIVKALSNPDTLILADVTTDKKIAESATYANEAAAIADDKATEFGYKYDKYWLNRVFTQAVDQANLPVSSFLTTVDAPADAGKYWRRADGTLWTMGTDGKEMQVDRNSPAFQALTVDDKCMGTGVGTTSGGKTCADYLRDCLSGTNVEKCKDYLMDSAFWTTAEKEVDSMLPAIALKTLESFEFNQEQVHDETAKMTLIKVVDVDRWLASLSGKLSSTDDVEKITKNLKLVGYLRMLVNKVNSNPAILNKGVSRSDEQMVNRLDAFKGSRLAKMGLRPRLAVSSLAPSSIERLGSAIRSDQDALRVRLLGPAIFGGLVGGGSTIEDLEARLSSENKQTWSALQSHFTALENQLKQQGKEIASADKEKIHELINNLRKSETKLTKVLLMTEKYNQLLSVHGQKDNNTVLRIDDLKQFVDARNRYFARVAKKQNDLISIIKSLAEAVQKEVPTKVESATAKLSLANLLG